MLGKILPPEVAAEEAFGDQSGVLLYPQEAALICGAVHDRQLEFSTGRWCARRALAALGLPPVPILPDPNGAPAWPRGITGSITHCSGYRAAAVAYTDDIAAIGIDAEPHQPLPAEVRMMIARPEEVSALECLAGQYPGISWDKIIFSAKESTYKAWYPVTQEWLDFGDVSIMINAVSNTFVARLLAHRIELAGRSLAELHGRWLVQGNLVLTSIAVPASSAF